MFALGPAVLWTLIVVPVTYCVYKFILFYADVRRRAKYIHKFPGDPPHPIWGHVHEFTEANEAGIKLLLDDAIKHPLMSKVWYGPFIPTLSVHHPSTMRELLRSSEPKPFEFGGYRLLKPWLGDGLLVSKGHKWARNRRLLTPAFHFDILKPYMEINNHCTDMFLSKLEKFAEAEEYFDIFAHVSLLTLDIILRCAFSYDNDCQIRGDNHPYVKAVNELQDTIVYRLLRPWLYPDVIFHLTPGGRKFKQNCKYVHSVSEEIIATRRKGLESGGDASKGRGRCMDFLDTLLMARDEDGQGLSDLDIRAEADTFLFEGHDTTASGISWALYDLACHPHIQTQCQDEVDDVLRGRDSEDILWEDLTNLKFTAMCMKESLRCHTPVPFIERQTTKDMEIDGYHLPAGTIVDMQLYVMHHNPAVWDDPMEYQPDRFLPENIRKKDTYAFVPFSAGPRNCIGQNFAMHEMKVVLARIMRRFTLTLQADAPTEHRIMVVMKTENGMWMKVTPRQHVL